MATKKLIEVALPLEKINAEAAREKSLHHGHPSTLHLWWARRPLAATRAIIWASLVDDPSSHPELYPSEEKQQAERVRLFRILEDLVVWENTVNQDVLNTAKAEILKSTNNNPPALLDPFSGGGAIPVEAQRLGLTVYANDLNPIPVVINKAMIEIPPLFSSWDPVNPEYNGIVGTNHGAEGLAYDVLYYGKLLQQRAFEKVGHLYPKVKLPKQMGEKEVPVIAWLWARTVNCPNPACECKVPLIKSRVLSKGKAYLEFYPDAAKKKIEIKVKEGTAKDPNGTVSRKGAVCPCCGAAIGFSYIREEGKNKRISDQLIAIVGKNNKGKIYLAPTIEHEMVAKNCHPEDIDFGDIGHYPGYLNPPAYGFTTFQSLFTKRQLTFLQSMLPILDEIEKQIVKDAEERGVSTDQVHLSDGGRGALAYGEAIRVYLAFLIDKMTDYNSSISSWNAVAQGVRGTFGMTGMSMSWDYAEANPFSGASGSFDNMLESIVKAIKWLPANGRAVVNQYNAQKDSGLRDVVISTDPPYYNNVPYADFSDYFYVWMRRNVYSIYPDLFGTMLTPKAEEIVADPYRVGSMEKACTFFENGMLEACQSIAKSASNDYPVTIYYAYKQHESDNEDRISSGGWETMLTAIIKAGLMICGTWPIRTEKPGRTRENGSNALASSIVLVCRKRPENASITTRRALIAELKREMRPALQKLQRSNIAPVDLAQSAIGPGMGVFSKYIQVLEADGTPMTVRSALQIINQELDIYFNEQDGELDRDSRFCLELYSQYAFNDIKFGDADILARAKSTSVAALASVGVVYASKGIVHLLGRDELSEKVDSQEECIWLLTQQLTRAMETGGVKACAEIAAPMFGANAEHAKDLAYRLYTIAERKGWAQEAYAYNSLVIAWPEIQSQAAELQKIQPEQLSIFD